MKHRVEYVAKMTCQGQIKKKEHCRYLWQAALFLFKWIRKYGKYGTMRFDIEAM